VHRRAGALDDGLYYRLVIAAGASPPGPGSVVARAWPVGFCACSAWRAGGAGDLGSGTPGQRRLASPRAGGSAGQTRSSTAC